MVGEGEQRSSKLRTKCEFEMCFAAAEGAKSVCGERPPGCRTVTARERERAQALREWRGKGLKLARLRSLTALVLAKFRTLQQLSPLLNLADDPYVLQSNIFEFLGIAQGVTRMLCLASLCSAVCIYQTTITLTRERRRSTMHCMETRANRVVV